MSCRKCLPGFETVWASTNYWSSEICSPCKLLVLLAALPKAPRAQPPTAPTRSCRRCSRAASASAVAFASDQPPRSRPQLLIRATGPGTSIWRSSHLGVCRLRPAHLTFLLDFHLISTWIFKFSLSPFLLDLIRMLAFHLTFKATSKVKGRDAG